MHEVCYTIRRNALSNTKTLITVTMTTAIFLNRKFFKCLYSLRGMIICYVSVVCRDVFPVTQEK